MQVSAAPRPGLSPPARCFGCPGWGCASGRCAPWKASTSRSSRASSWPWPGRTARASPRWCAVSRLTSPPSGEDRTRRQAGDPATRRRPRAGRRRGLAGPGAVRQPGRRLEPAARPGAPLEPAVRRPLPRHRRLGCCASSRFRSRTRPGPYASLSGGQRQLVAVARAMARRPRLLLLDEPTASLGVSESAQVEGLIARLRERGTTILLACHDIDQMFRLADRIVVLRHGRVVAEVIAGRGAPRRRRGPDLRPARSTPRRAASSTRLHGLADRLVSADPSSSLSLILSALGAALGSERLCIHLAAGDALTAPPRWACLTPLLSAWSRLPARPGRRPGRRWRRPPRAGHRGQRPQRGAAWAPFGDLARAAKVASSWSVPVIGPGRAARGDHRVPRRHRASRTATSSTWSRSTPDTRRAPSSATGCSTRSPRATACSRRSGRCWRPWPGRSRWPRGSRSRCRPWPGLQADQVGAADPGAGRRRRRAGRSSPRGAGADGASPPRGRCSTRPSGSWPAPAPRRRGEPAAGRRPATSGWRSRSPRPAGPDGAAGRLARRAARR